VNVAAVPENGPRTPDSTQLAPNESDPSEW
jgi:hypothetical protein